MINQLSNHILFTARVLIILCFSFQTYGQIDLFEEVTEEMLSLTKDELFPDAVAIILERNVEVEVGGYVIVKERVKIFNKEGYDYATVDFPHQNIEKISGQTYNLVDGKIAITQLNKRISLAGNDKGEKIKKLESFTMPQIREGSIFEYVYKATRGTFNDIPLQFSIPVKKINISIRNASRYHYDILQNPRALLDLTITKSNETTYLSKTNIAPLKNEKYVFDINQYRSKLEISTTGAVNNKKYNTFDKYVESLVSRTSFINGYKPVKTYQDDVAQVIKGVTDKEKQVELLYNFIKSHKKWNGYYGIWPDNESSRFAYKNPEGDGADINMLLISVLKSIGFTAAPVLVSSKRNGLPITPSSDVFNYVLAGVYLDGNLKLLDAASNKANYNMLPKPMVNWRGILIKDDKSYEWVDLKFQSVSKSSTLVTAQIDENLVLTGNVKYRLNGHYASDSQETLKDVSTEKFLKFTNIDDGNYEIENLTRKSVDTIAHQSVWSYEFTNEFDIEEVGDKIYLSPLLMYGKQTNPFKNEERLYPIDFGYPKVSSHMINISIPDGYKVQTIPEMMRIAMPENIGSYLYSISVVDNVIQVVSRFTIKESVVPIDFYGELRKFFSLRAEKEKETIVLVKK